MTDQTNSAQQLKEKIKEYASTMGEDIEYIAVYPNENQFIVDIR